MFFKKNKLYFEEERWCLGSQIEKSGCLLYPVFKITCEGTLKTPYFSLGQSLFQGVLQIREGKSIWIPEAQVSIETVMNHLPELKMNKEATHEY
jgi:hypothetical protein